MQPRDLRTLLGISHPIIQAPMAGGTTTPELVAAVSNAGALGSVGAAYLTAAHYGDSMVAAFFNMDKKDESWISVEATAGGWGGTVASIVADEGFELLDAPVRRVAAACVPLPFADALEQQVIPTVDTVTEAVRRLAAY